MFTTPTEYSSRRPPTAGQSGSIVREDPPFPMEARTMHRWLILVAIALMVFLPALAGDHGKCKYGTQECLDHMASQLKNSGWVGVELETDNPDGYAVSKVIPGS